MPVCKLLGGILLVCGAMGAGALYKAFTVRRLACVQALRTLLRDLRHTILQTGASIGEWLRTVRQNGARLARLGVLPGEIPADPASGTAGLRVLCHAASGQLPPAHDATKGLLCLADTMEGLRDRQAAVQALEALDGQLADLEQQTQQTLRQTCRAVQALCLCGALAVTILLW